jgi:anti-sigma B factor antagonist
LVEAAPGIPLVQLRGEIDLHTCPELRATLQQLMEAGQHTIVLNLAEVPYLDSAALGVLVDAVRRARENHGGIYLTHVTPFVRRAFEITRLIKIFQVHDSVEAAVAAIGARPSESAVAPP